VSEAANRAMIERFYHELWNRWGLAAADEIVSEEIRFRGSLGSTLEGRESVKGYVETVRAAFPDWHNRTQAAKAATCATRTTRTDTREARRDP
jgi:hypothetical protein